jgi:hypothetical protein
VSDWFPANLRSFYSTRRYTCRTTIETVHTVQEVCLLDRGDTAFHFLSTEVNTPHFCFVCHSTHIKRQKQGKTFECVLSPEEYHVRLCVHMSQARQGFILYNTLFVHLHAGHDGNVPSLLQKPLIKCTRVPKGKAIQSSQTVGTHPVKLFTLTMAP